MPGCTACPLRAAERAELDAQPSTEHVIRDREELAEPHARRHRRHEECAVLQPGMREEFVDIASLQKHFLQGCAEQGVHSADAIRVWEQIAGFASFAFCKSHAVTYGRIAYRTAWLKAHYPVAFLIAFLASETGYYPRRVYVEEARRLGVPILGPDVNRSASTFSAERLADQDANPGPLALRVGLAQVHGLSSHTLDSLLESRQQGPFLRIHRRGQGSQLGLWPERRERLHLGIHALCSKRKKRERRNLVGRPPSHHLLLQGQPPPYLQGIRG